MTQYSFLNVNPEGKRVGDCVKRAITLVANMDYHNVQLELNRYKKVTGAKKFNSDYNPNKFCENILKMEKISFPAEKGKSRMDGYSFANEYPKGRYILGMAHHWTSCVDGTIYDTWDCREKCVYYAYRLRSDEELEELQKIEKEAEKKALEEKESKAKRKAKEKKIKEKYSKKIKPLEKKIRELKKLMAKEIENLE